MKTALAVVSNRGTNGNKSGNPAQTGASNANRNSFLACHRSKTLPAKHKTVTYSRKSPFSTSVRTVLFLASNAFNSKQLYALTIDEYPWPCCGTNPCHLTLLCSEDAQP